MKKIPIVAITLWDIVEKIVRYFINTKNKDAVLICEIENCSVRLRRK